MSKKFEERNTALSNQLENVQKLLQKVYRITIRNHSVVFLKVREVKILEIAVIAAVNVDATEKTMVEDTAVIAQFFNVI